MLGIGDLAVFPPVKHTTSITIRITVINTYAAKDTGSLGINMGKTEPVSQSTDGKT